jgi:hypothetical protein
MTAEPLHPDGETNPDEGEVLHFEDPNADRDRTGDRQPFRIGDDDTILWARRPKLAALINIAARIGDATTLRWPVPPSTSCRSSWRARSMTRTAPPSSLTPGAI